MRLKVVLTTVAAAGTLVLTYVVMQGVRRRRLRTEETLARLLILQEEILQGQGHIRSALRDLSQPQQRTPPSQRASFPSVPTTPRTDHYSIPSLAYEWAKLRDTVLALHQAGGTPPAEVSHRGGGLGKDVLSVGSRVRVRRLDEVQSHCLWDPSSNRYCSREGLVRRIDVDGDIKVEFDDGDFFTCDGCFVGSVSEAGGQATSSLLATLWSVDRIIQWLRMQGSLGAAGTGALSSVGSATTPPQQAPRSNNSFTPFSVMCALTEE